MFSKQFNLTEASDAHGNLQSLGKIVPIGWQVVAWGCWLSLAEVSQKEDALPPPPGLLLVASRLPELAVISLEDTDFKDSLANNGAARKSKSYALPLKPTHFKRWDFYFEDKQSQFHHCLKSSWEVVYKLETSFKQIREYVYSPPKSPLFRTGWLEFHNQFHSNGQQPVATSGNFLFLSNWWLLWRGVVCDAATGAMDAPAQHLQSLHASLKVGTLN